MTENLQPEEQVNLPEIIGIGVQDHFTSFLPVYHLLNEPLNELQSGGPELAAWRLPGELTNSLVTIHNVQQNPLTPFLPGHVPGYGTLDELQSGEPVPELAAWRLTGELANSLVTIS